MLNFQKAKVNKIIDKRKKMTKKNNFHIVRDTRILATDTLQTIDPGTEVSVKCTEFAGLSTVHSAASRLNQRAGFKEFEVSTPDNGLTITIRRNIFIHDSSPLNPQNDETQV